MNRKRILLIIVLAAAAVAAGMILWLFGAFLPSYVTWNTAEITDDFDKDGTEETFLLKNRRFLVKRGDETLYSSPRLWCVSDLFVEDIDHDGYSEMIMIVWKHGSYGPHKPQWVEHDTIRFSQHVFIFRFRDGKVSSVWMSSDIGRAVKEAFMDQNARLHLIELTELGDFETVWEWLDWGLVLYNEAPAEKTVALLAVGDNLAHTSVYERAFDPDTGQFDFSPIYEKVKGKISAYDLAIVNQETIFVEDAARRSGFPLFATPQSMGDALAEAGFDVILGANNHAYDQGELGLTDTLNFWKRNHSDVTVLGLHNMEEDYNQIDYLLVNGIRIALFNYTEMLGGMTLQENEEYKINLLKNKDKLLSDLNTAEKEADFSICFLHIGDEYEEEPAERVRELASELANAGADLIICSHPHVLQGMEWVEAEGTGAENTEPEEYRLKMEAAETEEPEKNDSGKKKALVYYSLGNFMSHQMDERTVPGGAAQIFITKVKGGKAKITACDLLPLVCHFDGKATQVYFLEDYSEELAKEHSINRKAEENKEEGFTVQGLWNKVEEIRVHPK